MSGIIKKILVAEVVLMMAVSVFGCLSHKRVELRAGVHITEAYHYYPDGQRCHCMVIAGFMPGDDPYLDAHDFRIEDSNGQTCTLVFKIGDSNELYCLDNYPLSNLDY